MLELLHFPCAIAELIVVHRWDTIDLHISWVDIGTGMYPCWWYRRWQWVFRDRRGRHGSRFLLCLQVYVYLYLYLRTVRKLVVMFTALEIDRAIG